MSRRFWHNFETGRSGFTDGDLPSGPLVEEITALEFYQRESVCVCGKLEKDGKRCAYGASHKGLTRYFYHPESNSLFTTFGDEPSSDGLVEEISKDEYERIEARIAEDEALS